MSLYLYLDSSSARYFFFLLSLTILIGIMKRVYVVYDAAVRDFYADFRHSIKGEILGELALICDEQHKSLSSVENICRAMLAAGTEKSDTLLCVGGGVCSDICGLAAALYKRGMRFEIVPTTLLSMADASIGGKNGVNLKGMKNVIGTFYPCSKVYIRKEVLRSLPEEEILSGSAEILKTLLLFDEKAYQKAVGTFSEWAKGEHGESLLDEMTRWAEKSAKLKARIVKRDPFDKGRRHLLNFGHTFAHAIEWKSEEKISHGEAVAIGIIQALRLSERNGWCEKGLADRIRDDFRRCKLPTELPYEENELAEALKNDKKIENGTVDFVSIKRIGKPLRKKIKI